MTIIRCYRYCKFLILFMWTQKRNYSSHHAGCFEKIFHVFYCRTQYEFSCTFLKIPFSISRFRQAGYMTYDDVIYGQQAGHYGTGRLHHNSTGHYEVNNMVNNNNNSHLEQYTSPGGTPSRTKPRPSQPPPAPPSTTNSNNR